MPHDRPCTGANFLVSFGGNDARAASAGFSEVIFPTFTLDPADPRAGSGSPGETLVLKRGVTGKLDLYAWWNKARRGRAPQRRTVKVELLGEDHERVAMTWLFRNARPVSLAYSPLNALEGGVVVETLELAFDSFEMR
ncbi:MAG: phage tail protein [Burkholderiales bacterium]